MSESNDISITIDADASPRVKHGADLVRAALPGTQVRNVSIGVRGKGRLANQPRGSQPPGGFRLLVGGDCSIDITSDDDSGALYGCVELVEQLKSGKPLEARLDAPVFRLRGPCIGMQKTYILPGRKVYEYPYTDDLFPFFYDRALWTKYLDYLLTLRFNSLTLWNGHPFASFVRVPKYDYAVEVSPEQFQRNVDTLHWLTSECDKRGIWLLKSFYSLLLPKPFAEKHHCDTQLTAPTPEASDYTREAIAAFVADFPNVGLMPCLGEALQGIDNQVYWCNDVILEGIKQGATRAGLKELPPVVLRTHATDARVVIPKALQRYSNLYTEQKYNGESLTTYEPRGVRADLHRTMAALGSTHMVNVHILANLEPFRYGAQRFIQNCMLASRDLLGAKGLHLYPLAYWNWPHSPDGDGHSLIQWERDDMWFESWARYSWNPDRDRDAERDYWVSDLAKRYGSVDAAGHILDALNDSGECARASSAGSASPKAIARRCRSACCSISS
ncbi:MAG: hypothetical protein QM770_10210 [Tepidisphaeraceae bacterium]